MNFGTILNSVTKTCVTLMIESKSVESKTLVKDFIGYIQLKDVLLKQFRVYNQLNASYIRDKDSAKLFVNETLATLEKFDFNDILSYNHLLETKFNVPKMAPSDINLDISKLIKYRTSVEKCDQIGYIKAFDKIVEHVSTFRKDNGTLSELSESISNSSLKFLQPKHIIRIALNKFNDRYTSGFNDEDRVIFNILRENDIERAKKIYDSKFSSVSKTITEIKKDLGEELSTKVLEAIEKISSGYTQENLLNVHELEAELTKLKEES